MFSAGGLDDTAVAGLSRRSQDDVVLCRGRPSSPRATSPTAYGMVLPSISVNSNVTVGAGRAAFLGETRFARSLIFPLAEIVRQQNG
jgi:hypothetical protein